MQIKDKFPTEVKYVSPSTPLNEVAALMEQHDCGSILVAKDEKLTGVVTDRDIVLRCLAQGKDPANMTAGDCQTPEVLYCFETDEAEDILRNMADNKVRRLPVLDNAENKKLIGIISFGDVSTICSNKELCGEAMKEIRKAA